MSFKQHQHQQGSPSKTRAGGLPNQNQSANSPGLIGGIDEIKTDWRLSLKKSVIPAADWPDKDELLDVLYWLKQILSIIIGIVWAIIPLQGIVGLAAYVALSTLVGHFYITSFQKVDEDSLGGAWEMAKEGFGSAFATFMIFWIVGYSALYFPS